MDHPTPPPTSATPAAAGPDPAARLEELLTTLRGLLGIPELSLAAKAALVYAATRPAGHVLSRAELLGLGRDPRWQVDAALAELLEDGWLDPVVGGFVVRTDPDPDDDQDGEAGS
jgi:hypothetical protein